jgi:hypothetical protein
MAPQALGGALVLSGALVHSITTWSLSRRPIVQFSSHIFLSDLVPHTGAESSVQRRGAETDARSSRRPAQDPSVLDEPDSRGTEHIFLVQVHIINGRAAIPLFLCSIFFS